MVEWYYQNKRGDYFEIVDINPDNVNSRIFKKQFFALPITHKRKNMGRDEICRFDFTIERIVLREFSDEILDKIIFRWGAAMIARELEKEEPRKEFKFTTYDFDFNQYNWFLKFPKRCSHLKKENNYAICSINNECESSSEYTSEHACENCIVPDDFNRCKHLISRTNTGETGKQIRNRNAVFGECAIGRTISDKNHCSICEAREPIFLTIANFTVENVIDKVKKAIERGLRKSIGDRRIEKEFEIRDIIDGLLATAGYDFKKETPREKFSAKGFQPDLTSESLSTAIEAKLIDSKDDVSRSVEGLSADIEPYKASFKNILFVVYDLGFVSDVDEYCKDFERIDGVDILLIKK